MWAPSELAVSSNSSQRACRVFLKKLIIYLYSNFHICQSCFDCDVSIHPSDLCTSCPCNFHWYSFRTCFCKLCPVFSQEGSTITSIIVKDTRCHSIFKTQNWWVTDFQCKGQSNLIHWEFSSEIQCLQLLFCKCSLFIRFQMILKMSLMKWKVCHQKMNENSKNKKIKINSLGYVKQWKW